MSQQRKRPQAKRTAFAQQAVDFSDYFDMLFEKVVIKGDVPRVPSLAAPEGISTGGGKQARQHLVLKPEEETALSYTVGWVDRTQGMVELRTYDYLVEQHRQRFGKKPFALDQDTYDKFFNKAKDFFTREKMPVKIETAPRLSTVSPGAAPAAATSGRGMLLLVVVLSVLLVAAVTAAVVFALR